jgi:hypothetical protein
MPSHRYDLCEVGRADGQPFAAVALTARGRTYVDERTATQRLRRTAVAAARRGLRGGKAAGRSATWPA